jgi:hypothetical protein
MSTSLIGMKETNTDGAEMTEIRIVDWRNGDVQLECELTVSQISDMLGEENGIDTHYDTLIDAGLTNAQVSMYYALVAGRLPQNQQENSNWRDETTAGIVLMDDARVDSWVTELIQNSQDCNATRLALKIDEEGLSFAHDGDQIKPKELSSLLRMYATTKKLDVRSIGKFGVGFKYWLQFFKQCEIQIRDGLEKHKLIIDFSDPEENDPNGKLPRYIAEQANTPTQKTTVFQFRLPSQGNEDFQGADYISQRVSKSLALLVEVGDNADFSLDIIQNVNNEPQSKRLIATQEPIQDVEQEPLEADEVGHEVQAPALPQIHKVGFGIHGEPQYEMIRFSFSNEWVGHHCEEEYEQFQAMLVQEYMRVLQLRGKVIPEEQAREAVAEGLGDENHRYMFNIAYDRSENAPEGYLASRFIADETQLNIPFLIDAPFNLNTNRLGLNLQQVNNGRAWNEIVLKISLGLQQWVVEKLFTWMHNGHQMAPLTAQDMDSLLNTRIEARRDHNLTPLLQGAADINWINPFLSGQMNRAASEPLMELWRHLRDEEANQALEWFFGALDDRICFATIGTGDLPTRILLSSQSGIPAVHQGAAFVQNCGDGVPDEIRRFIDETEDQNRRGELESLIDSQWTQFGSDADHHIFSGDADPNGLFLSDAPEADGPLEALLLLADDIQGLPMVYLPVNRDRNHTESVKERVALEKIVKSLFNLSRQAANEHVPDVISLEALKQLLARHGENGILHNMMVRENPNTGDSYLVKLPQDGHVVGIQCSGASYDLVSLRSNASHNLNRLLTAKYAPYIIPWGPEAKQPLWFYGQDDIRPPEPTYQVDEDSFWRSATFRQPTGEPDQWNWVVLAEVNALKPIQREYVVIDLFDLRAPLNQEEEIVQYRRTGVFGNISTATDGTSMGAPYRYTNNYPRPVSFQANPTVSEALLRGAARFPDPDTSVEYQWDSCHFNPDRVRPYAFVRARGMVHFLLEELEKTNRNPVTIYKLAQLHERCVHRTSSFFDVYWTRNSDSQPYNLRLNCRRIQSAAGGTTTIVTDPPRIRQSLQIEPVHRTLANPVFESLDIRYMSNNSRSHMELYEVCGGPGTLPYPVREGEAFVPPGQTIIGYPVHWNAAVLEKLQKSADWKTATIEPLRDLVQQITERELHYDHALDWIERLVANNITWWGNQLQERGIHGNTTMRVVLRNTGLCIQEEYPVLNQWVARGEQAPIWTTFENAVSHGLDAQQMAERFSQTVAPSMRNGNQGLEIDQEARTPTLSQIPDECRFFDCKIPGKSMLVVDEGTQLLGIGETRSEIKFRLNNLLTEAGWIQQDQFLDLSTVLLRTHAPEQAEAELPPQLLWLQQACQHLNPPIEVHHPSTESTPERPVHFGIHCPSISRSVDGVLTLYPPQRAKENYDVDDHVGIWDLFQASFAQTHPGGKDLLQNSDLIGPWSVGNMDDGHNREHEFMQQYCSHQGDLGALMRRLTTLNIEDADQVLSSIKSMYRTQNQSLYHTKEALRNGRLYPEGHPSMIPELTYDGQLTGGVYSLAHFRFVPDAVRTILSTFQQGCRNFASLGEYITINAIEKDHLIRGNCFLVDDFAERFKESLFETLEQDSENQWVYVSNAVELNGFEREACLNKVHLCMIVGWFMAAGVYDAD